MKQVTRILPLFFLLGFFSCGQSPSDNQTAGSAPVQSVEAEGDESAPPPPPPPGNEGITIERKLIREGTVEYKVDNLATERARLLKAIEKWKGYVGNESEYNTSDRYSTTLIIRVPAANFDSLLAAATFGIEHFDRKDIHVQDVTEEFVDIEARMKTKKDLELRYLELLKKANKVEEMLQIEREIGVLREEIESIEGRLNVMKSQVSFSTLTVTLYETVSAPGFFGDRVGSGFVAGWNYLLDFMVGLVNFWPFILLGAGAIWGFKKWRLRKKGK